MKRIVQVASYAKRHTLKKTIVLIFLALIGYSLWAQTSGRWGDNLSWTFSDGTLTIKGDGEMKEADYTEYPWYTFINDIDRLVINEGVSSIAAEAFYKVRLTKLILPDGVEFIGEHAFGNNNELTCLSLPASLLNSSIITPSLFYHNIAESMDSLIIRGQADSIDLTLLDLQHVFYMEYPTFIRRIKTNKFYKEGIKTPYNNDMLRCSNLYDVNGDGKMEFVDTDYDRGEDGKYYHSFYYCNPMGIPIDTIIDNIYDINQGSPCFFNYNNTGISIYNFNPSTNPNLLEILTDENEILSYDITNSDLLCIGDINADGRTDIVTNNGTYLKQTDDIYIPTMFEFIDTTQVDSLKYLQITNSGLFTSGLDYNNVVSGYMPPEYNNTAILIDLDQNGYNDVVEMSTGNVMFNYGHNKFIAGNLGGALLTIRDLNKDNIPDLILYDKDQQETKLMYYDKNGQFTIQSLVKDLIISQAWSYDFDKDGDADILLAFDYNSNMGYSFLVFYRNDGNNQYTQIEQAFMEMFYFQECKDIDNDGLYEVIAYKDEEDHDALRNFNVLEYDHSLHFTIDTNSKFNNIYKYISDICVGDIDNDGKIEFIYEVVDNSKTNPIFSEIIDKFDGQTNTSPHKMDSPHIMYDGTNDKLEISWGDGQDAETSSVDLTYALRIGSEPGKGDVLYAHATSDGRRLNLRPGNMGYMHNYWFDVSGLPRGNYYIAVQAIDANFMGGEWSDEIVYERNTLGAGFNISANNITTVDTLVISLTGVKNENLIYEWNFGDSTTIVKEENNRIYLYYNTAGERDITLTVKDQEGNISETSSRNVAVYACKLDEVLVERIDNPIVERIEYPIVDFNMDGAIDGFQHMEIIPAFYENDGTGKFNAVNKIFNLNLALSTIPAIFDYNMDGAVDIVAMSNKGNVLINNGNLNFGFVSEENTAYFEYGKHTWHEHFTDFNNDGFPDLYGDKNYLGHIILKNMGGLTFGDTINMETLYSDTKIYDLNRDGYIDLISTIDSHPIFFINKGNWIFEEKNIENVNLRKGNRDYYDIADIDCDGYVDIVDQATDMTFKIYYGDAENRYEREETIYLTEVPSEYKIVDVDNNGYPDIIYSYDADESKNSSDMRQRIIYNGGYKNKKIGIDNSGNLGNKFTDINCDGKIDIAGFYTSLNRTRITNTPPSVPTGLRVNQGAEGVMLAWNDSQDKETPITQMRYNISVKKKGATGEGAYIISPLNGGVDSAAISPAYHYLRSTRMTIPLERFEKGVEYEFCVQAIDAWNETSAMSEPVSFVFEGGEGITVSNYEVCIGEEITATFVSTDNNVPVWSSEGGYMTEMTDETITVYWSERGQKKLTATAGGKTYTAVINVMADTTDLSFRLPSMVLGGAPVHFTLPSAFSDPTKEIEIESEAYIQRRGTTLDAIAVFPERDGEYSITFRTSDKGQCGITEHTQYVQVVGNNITPVISIVGIDETTGKNKIEWDVPDNVFERTDLFDQIWVYKEGGKTEEYIKLAELPLTATSYIDMSSDPSVRKSRYRITLHTTYGGESKPSATHSNVHVMLNKGLHNSVNIIWTKYEGAMIEQYTILKGTSPDNMSVLTTASGNETSYTDQNVQDEENVYYALSYSNTYETEWIPMNPFDTQRKTLGAGRATNVASGQSNIVTSGEIIHTVFPTELNIMHLEAMAELTPYQQSLHLYPELLPMNASIKQVTWNITAGHDLAAIDDYGTLTYIGNGESGSVTVEAKTIDGSNLTNSITIPVDWTYAPVLVEEMTVIPNQIEITPENNNVQLTIDVQPSEATDKSYTWSVENGYEGYVSISEDNILTGKRNTYDYITITATANDGSGITATAEVSVSGLRDYPLTETINVYGIWEDSTSVSAEFPNTQLYADYTPSNAQPEISWSVIEGTDIITVDQNGYVTFLYEPGRAVVRASANDGSGVYDDYIVIGDITYVDTLKIMHDNQQDDDTIYLTPNNNYTYVWGEKIPSENEAAFSNVIWEFVAGDNSIVHTEDEMVGWGLGLNATGKSGRTTLRATVDDKRAAYDEVEIVASGFDPLININLTDSILTPNMTTIYLDASLTTYEWQEENWSFSTIYTPMDWEIVNNEEIAELTIDEWGNYNLRAKEKNGEITLRAFTTYNGVYYSKDTVIKAKDFSVELESMEIVSNVEVLTPENPCLKAEIRYMPENAKDKEVGWRIDDMYSGANVQITETTDSTCVVCADSETTDGSFTLVAYKRFGDDLFAKKTFELAGFETGMSVAEANKPIIYPTVVDEIVYLENLKNNCEIIVNSIGGVTMMRIMLDEVRGVHPIDVSDLASGAYFISLRMENGKDYIYKFLKR